jgi:DNA-directed RNA polymerase specialized sigma24 family protein
VAVLLRYEEGLSYEEIGRMSRERPPTVQARVARALPVLRRCLDERRAAP